MIANKTEITNQVLDKISKRFIAFDIETTGLSPTNDRIIEVGAVLFENGMPVNQYGSLINIHAHIPTSATAVNNITDDMIAIAPNEATVFNELAIFLGDSLIEQTIICAHNATFDISFLCESLMRFGYNGRIKYADTLSFSKQLIKGLQDYKQNTLAAHFGIINSQSHRAFNDAVVCGKILCELIKLKEIENQQRSVAIEANKPNEEEREICAIIQKIILDNGGDAEYLGFYKNSSGYVDIIYVYSFLKFKISKKGKYIIIDKSVAESVHMPIEQCTMSEGGTVNVRAFFNYASDLNVLSTYIYQAFKKCRESANDYLLNSRHRKEYLDSTPMLNSISSNELKTLLNSAETRKNNTPISEIVLDSPKSISRSDVTINPINDRVPLFDIKNLDNWDRGFDEGYHFYEEGEVERKDGNLEKAIHLYDLARYNGYNAPVLYDSYAMAYHKLKDYENEIDILDEGIKRTKAQNGNTSQLEARQIKAIQALVKMQEETKRREEKQAAKEKKKHEQEEKAKSSSTTSARRSILKMNDDGVLLQRYESIADAVKDTGISSKSIRDAAKGVQKHAGGFVWKYADD